MGGIQYVYWPGTSTRLTPWMLYCLQRLDADLQRLFGVRLALDSSVTQRGIRTSQEQVDLFLSRYRLQASGSGPFGDVRWWQGRRYVRHSGAGTVAAPGGSNHEIQGSTAAVDVADSGGAGIGTMGSARSNWLRANASRYGLVPEGFSFNEAWHYSIPNIFAAVPAGGGGVVPAPSPQPESEEDDMPKNSGFIYRGSTQAANQRTVLICNYGSGLFHEYTNGTTATDSAYNAAIAKAFDTTSFAEISESHAASIKKSLTAA